MTPEELQLTLLTQIKDLLKQIIRRLPEKSNTHETFEFDTSGTSSFHKDVYELLSLPKGYYANNMTIIDIGGGFTFKINGENSAITAIKNMRMSEEELYKIEFIPATSAGTAKVRFGAYINHDE